MQFPPIQNKKHQPGRRNTTIGGASADDNMMQQLLIYANKPSVFINKT
jgi:hypothetical protein